MDLFKKYFQERKSYQKFSIVMWIVLLSTVMLLISAKQIVLAEKGQKNIFTTLQKIILPTPKSNNSSSNSLTTSSLSSVQLGLTKPSPALLTPSESPGGSSSIRATPTPMPGTTGSSGSSSIPSGITTKVTINPSSIGLSVPSQFAGISTETVSVCSMLTLDGASSEYSQLFKNLGSETMRVGGNSGDQATWSPNGTYCPGSPDAIDQQEINNWITFINKIGWNFTWAVNLGTYDPVDMAAEADYVYTTAGNSLYAIAIGNEPNNFVGNGYRSSGYGATQYIPEWQAYQAAIAGYSSSIPLMGDDQSQNTSWFNTFISDEASILNQATFHFYPTSSSGTGSQAPTISNLLSSTLMSSTVSTLKQWIAIATANNLPIAISETNSTSGGGKAGLSNAFAATLWASDYMFNALELGVRRMNFHGIGGASYTAIDNNGNTKPLYYAFLFFHAATQNGGNVITPTVTSASNTPVHVILGGDGKLYIAIINKDLNNTAVVDIHTTQNYSQASIEYLTAPSVSSTSGVTFGGASVANDGTFSPTTSPLSMYSSTDTYVTLSPTEAALVTLQ